MFQYKERYHVYITHNTYRGMLLEAGRHPGKESIIQMPGIRIGNDFYFDMVADSGIHATYTPTMCEKDHVYADHLATRISEYYDYSNGKLTVSQVHRHPNGCLRFSTGDYPANLKLAQQFGGVVNGLIFIDPEFRIKFWYIDENGDETEVAYEINDKAVRAAMPRINLYRLKETVERNEAARAAVKKTEYRPMEEKETKGSIFSRLNGFFKGHTEEEKSHMDSKTEKSLQTAAVLAETESVNADSTDDFMVDDMIAESAAGEAFMDFEKIQETLRPYTVLIPEEYRKQRFEGELRGYYHPETKTFHIVPEELYSVRTDTKVLGVAVREEQMDRREGDLFITWIDDEVKFSIKDHKGAGIHIDEYSCQQDVFSRNQGIVEKDRMAENRRSFPVPDPAVLKLVWNW